MPFYICELCCWKFMLFAQPRKDGTYTVSSLTSNIYIYYDVRKLVSRSLTLVRQIYDWRMIYDFFCIWRKRSNHPIYCVLFCFASITIPLVSHLTLSGFWLRRKRLKLLLISFYKSNEMFIITANFPICTLLHLFLPLVSLFIHHYMEMQIASNLCVFIRQW